MSIESARITLEKKLRSAISPWEKLPILMELSKESHPHDMNYSRQKAQEALTIARSLNDRYWIAQGLWGVGTTLMPTGRYSEALHYLQQASPMFRQLADLPMKAHADLNIAILHIFTGKFNEAMALLMEASPILETAGNQLLNVRANRYIGYIHSALGDHGKGLEHYHRGIAVATESGHKQELAYLLQSVALLYRNLGDRKQHRSYLFQCLKAHHQLRNNEGIAVAMSNIANMYLEQERFLYAERYIRQSGLLFRKLGFAPQEGLAWGQLAAVWNYKGDFARAAHCYRKGIALLEGGENKLFLANLYEYFGIACKQAGQLRKGLHYMKKALRILTESNHTAYIHDVHENISTVYQDLGETEKAFAHYRKYVRLKEKYVNSGKALEAGRIEMRTEIERLTNRLHKAEEQAALLNRIMEKKEAELRDLTLSMIRDEAEGKRRRGQNSIFSVTGTKKKQRGTDLSNNWETFARQFHKVHYDFYTGLIRRYPNLTPAEIKVCSLIRIGLSSKEIADILCISKGTVDKHRVRIHKKLELTSGSSLAGFIAHM